MGSDVISIEPTYYDLHIYSYLPSLEFGGKVKINVSVKAASSSFMINSVDLNITKAEIASSKGAEALKVSYKPHFAILDSSVNIAPGNYFLSLEWEGTMKDGEDKGFFRSRTNSGFLVAGTHCF